MEKVKLTIDDQDISVGKDANILQAALENDIYIPHLCFHPDLRPAGVCRVCMVEIEGRGMAAACMTLVEEGMVVRTESEQIRNVRSVSVELMILSNHWDCLTCAKNSNCELQRVANYVGVDKTRISRLRKSGSAPTADDSNPFFIRDLAKCILCGICVRTCDELVGVGAIDFGFRSNNTKITAFGNKPILESRCVSCGECVVRCPVGALIPKNMEKPAREVSTVCTYCGCGCGILLGVRGDRIVSVRGDTANPVSKGRLCVKGRFGNDFVHSPERLTKPLIKRDGKFVEADWDEALDLVADKLAKHRGNEFAAIASAKCTNEDNYLLQKFTRAVMKTNNIDHCARL
jgi:formate dehydrogenase major subunit